MTRIAVFASGNGSNAENLIRNLTAGEVVLLLCNNPKAYVLKRAEQLQVPAVVFSRAALEATAEGVPHVPAPSAPAGGFAEGVPHVPAPSAPAGGFAGGGLHVLALKTAAESFAGAEPKVFAGGVPHVPAPSAPAGTSGKGLEATAEAVPHVPVQEAMGEERSVLGLLKAHRVDFIVLAGFLWKIPAHVIREWPGRIVNIHPALLPKYGGAGMYGERVHREVIRNAEKESGITIHVVDGLYDNGRILFQATCHVDRADTPETLAGKIHLLEQQYFPAVVDKYINR